MAKTLLAQQMKLLHTSPGHDRQVHLSIFCGKLTRSEKAKFLYLQQANTDDYQPYQLDVVRRDEVRFDGCVDDSCNTWVRLLVIIIRCRVLA